MAFRKVLDIYGAYSALNDLLFKVAWLFKAFRICSENLVQLSIFSFVRTLFNSFLSFEEWNCF